MKTNIIIQANGKDTLVADLDKAVKDELKDRGIKQTAIKTLNVYFKPNENECFYVAVDKDGNEFDGKAAI